MCLRLLFGQKRSIEIMKTFWISFDLLPEKKELIVVEPLWFSQFYQFVCFFFVFFFTISVRINISPRVTSIPLPWPRLNGKMFSQLSWNLVCVCHVFEDLKSWFSRCLWLFLFFRLPFLYCRMRFRLRPKQASPYTYVCLCVCVRNRVLFVFAWIIFSVRHEMPLFINFSQLNRFIAHCQSLIVI